MYRHSSKVVLWVVEWLVTSESVMPWFAPHVSWGLSSQGFGTFGQHLRGGPKQSCIQALVLYNCWIFRSRGFEDFCGLLFVELQCRPSNGRFQQVSMFARQLVHFKELWFCVQINVCRLQICKLSMEYQGCRETLYSVLPAQKQWLTEDPSMNCPMLLPYFSIWIVTVTE